MHEAVRSTAGVPAIITVPEEAEEEQRRYAVDVPGGGLRLVSAREVTSDPEACEASATH